MSKSRMPLVLGLGAAGGIGYYLYNAGGNAKAAENKFESTFITLFCPRIIEAAWLSSRAGSH